MTPRFSPTCFVAARGGSRLASWKGRDLSVSCSKSNTERMPSAVREFVVAERDIRHDLHVTSRIAPGEKHWTFVKDARRGRRARPCWDGLHRMSGADDVPRSIHRPARHDCACLRHFGRCQPTLSSRVSTMVQYRWTGAGSLLNPESIKPTTSESHMVISIESVQHE